MRLSKIAVIYFMMGTIVVGAGVVPPDQIGIAQMFVDVSDSGVTMNQTSVGGDGGGDGMLDNLIGPIVNSMNTITGGALLAVWGPIGAMIGFAAWPVMVANYINAPREVILVLSVLVASFTFGVLRVFRDSI